MPYDEAETKWPLLFKSTPEALEFGAEHVIQVDRSLVGGGGHLAVVKCGDRHKLVDAKGRAWKVHTDGNRLWLARDED